MAGCFLLDAALLYGRCLMRIPIPESRNNAEMLFRAIFEQAAIGIALIDSNTGQFVKINQRYCEITGYPREEMEKLTYREISHPDDLLSEMENMRLLLSRAIHQFSKEKRYIRKDGSIVWVNLTVSPMWGPGEEPSTHIAIVEDITESKRAEELNSHFASIVESSDDAIISKSLDGIIKSWNTGAEKIYGYTAVEIVGKNISILAPADQPDEFPRLMARLGSGQSIDSYETWRIRKDGSRIMVSLGISPIKDGSGAIVGASTIARDITEHKHAETRLNDQLHFLQQLLDSIPIPVYYKGADGIYLGCNSAFETFIGLSRSQVVGKTAYELAPKDLADAYHEADSALFSRPGIQVYETSVMHKDGTRHDVIFNKATYVGADGRVIGIVGAIMDITERRKAEEERKILEAQLHQAQKMEAIGQLAGGIAHDFNNILTAIIGYAEIIFMRLEKESPLRHFIEQVLTSAERAAELTNGLLAFSRRQVLHTKPIDLCGVVRGLEKMLGRLVPEDIDFSTNVVERDLIVMADKGQIEQVLMNLVTNAKDAMPRGGCLKIDVSPAAMDERFVHTHGFGESGNYACISVTDTGHGMDEETRKRIFEPFFTTKEVGKGTGLGMAIIYGIIQQHNGYITVNSETGSGTTFKIYLPLIVEEIKEVHGTRGAEAPPGGTETILLAEDEVTVRELHKMILEEAGYRIIEAVDGQDALDKFLEHRGEVDILATDVIMPKIDGKNLYEKIRKIRPDMKALFMSGYTKDIIVERGILEDESSFMTKPVTSSELLRKVRDLLARK